MTEEEQKPEPTPEPVKEPKKKLSKLEETKQTLENIKKATEEYKAFVERAEKIRSNEILAGRAEAGQAPPKPKVETPAEYAARVLRGEV